MYIGKKKIAILLTLLLVCPNYNPYINTRAAATSSDYLLSVATSSDVQEDDYVLDNDITAVTATASDIDIHAFGALINSDSGAATSIESDPLTKTITLSVIGGKYYTHAGIFGYPLDSNSWDSRKPYLTLYFNDAYCVPGNHVGSGNSSLRYENYATNRTYEYVDAHGNGSVHSVDYFSIEPFFTADGSERVMSTELPEAYIYLSGDEPSGNAGNPSRYPYGYARRRVFADRIIVRTWENVNVEVKIVNPRDYLSGYQFFDIASNTAANGSLDRASAFIGDTSTQQALGEVVESFNTYLLSYNSNIPGHSIADVRLRENENHTIASLPAYRGYEFLYWESGDGVRYTQGQTVSNLAPIGRGITLTAIWRPISYNIRYNTNTGSGSMENTVCTYDAESFVADNFFEKSGYTFVKWNTLPNGTGTDYHTRTRVFNLTDIDGEIIDLYAIWEPIQYSVKYMPNTGSGTAESDILIYDMSSNLRENYFTKEGYIFNSWNTAADGTGIRYAAGASVINLSTVNRHEIILYAVWEPIEYKVIYMPNGAIGDVIRRRVVYDTDLVVENPGYFKRFFTLKSFNSLSDGSGTDYIPGQRLRNLTSTLNTEVFLHAQYERVSYLVRFFDKYDNITAIQDVRIGHRATPPDASYVDGYTFVGWDTDFLNIQNDLDIKPIYNANTSTVAASSNEVQRGNDESRNSQENVPLNPEFVPVLDLQHGEYNSLTGSGKVRRPIKKISSILDPAQEIPESVKSDVEEEKLPEMSEINPEIAYSFEPSEPEPQAFPDGEAEDKSGFIQNIISAVVKNPIARTFVLSLFLILCMLPLLLFVLTKHGENKLVRTPDGLFGYVEHSNPITGQSVIRITLEDGKAVKKMYPTNLLQRTK